MSQRCLWMLLELQIMIKADTDRNLQAVFDEFTAGPEDYLFDKTIIPVHLAQYENEKLMSRSQAKRLLARVDKFKPVVFDFDGVSTVGQAFADEIFRVYALKHPQMTLLLIKMEEVVSKMVKRAIFARDEKINN